MNIVLCDSAEQATRLSATLIYREVAARPHVVLGWATGGTMDLLYRELVSLHRACPIRWSDMRCFHLDEYVGLAADHPMSYGYFMRHKVFDPLGVREVQAHLLRGDAPDLQEECRRYEDAIAAAGGIDLQLLGIGENGHIAFNEPGSSLDSRTRIVHLNPDTLTANRRFFPPGVCQPESAITLGIQTILDGRQIVMLAIGEKKASAVAAMAEGPLSAMCPASALQMHPATTVVLDPSAAQRLRLKDRYRRAGPADLHSA